MAVPFALTEDGFETQWQINYLSQFLFIRSLLPLLETTAANSRSTSQSRVRIVNVSSDAAFAFAPKTLDLKAPNLEYVMGPMAAWLVPDLPSLLFSSLTRSDTLPQQMHDNGQNRLIYFIGKDTAIPSSLSSP